MKRRLGADKLLARTVVTPITFFESTLPPRHSKFSRSYFQVFEWVEAGSSLHDLAVGEGKAYEADKALIWCKQLLKCVERLHDADIIHIDLKPWNVMMLADASTSGYRLHLIDMDFSILSDRQAPWHGHEGYVGTPGYMSPEHLRGEVPQKASDIFTCGIMLAQVLAKKHPFHTADDPDRAVLNHQVESLKIDNQAHGDRIVEIITQMLHPDPRRRPTTQVVLDTLNDRSSGSSGPQ